MYWSTSSPSSSAVLLGREAEGSGSVRGSGSKRGVRGSGRGPTCTRDTSRFPFHSSAAGRTPGRSTAEPKDTSVRRGGGGGREESGCGSAHLYVSAVVASGRQLDAPEGDGTFEGHLDGRLLHAVLSVQPGGARDGAAAEVPLY